MDIRHGLRLAATLILILGAAAPLMAGTAAELYEEGLTQESSEGNLETAIATFRRLLQEHPEAGSVAANAQLHIGICYEKLGRREAREAYAQVIANFPGEAAVVAQAREHLASLDRTNERPQRRTGAGPERTREVVARLERQLARVQTYRGTMAVTVELMGQPQRSEGPVLFRRPNLTRTEMTGPLPIGRMVSVNDGSRMWIHQSTANLISMIDMATLNKEFPQIAGQNSELRVLQGLDSTRVRFIRTDRIGSEAVEVFQGEPDSVAARLGYGQAIPAWYEAAIGAADGLTRRLVGYRDTGAEMIRTETAIEAINVPLPDSAFVFTPPAGAQVMDMTAAVRSLCAKAAGGAPEGSGGSVARPPDAREIIAKIEQARTGRTSSRSKVELQMHMMGATTTMNGTEWEQEGRSRQEVTSPMAPGLTIAIDDSTVRWSYRPEMKMVTRIDRRRVEAAAGPKDPSAKSSGFEGMARDSAVYVGQEQLTGEEVYHLRGPSVQGQSPMPGIELGQVEVWIGTRDGIIRHRVVYDRAGKEVTVETRTEVEVNLDLPDSLFTFTPPAGVQIMDMTEMAIKAAQERQGRSGESPAPR